MSSELDGPDPGPAPAERSRVRAAVGVGLRMLARSMSRPSRLTLLSWSLCAPLALLLAAWFLFPLIYVAHSGLHNPVVGSAWPELIRALKEDPDEVPGEKVFRTLARELARQRENEAYKATLKPFSQQDPELWRLLQRSVETLPPEEFESAKAWMIGVDSAWAEAHTWMVIRRVAAPYTTHYLVNALDGSLTPEGRLRLKPEQRRGYGLSILDTLTLGIWVASLTLVLGFPLAYRLVTLPTPRARLTLNLILAVLWTSVLVKTYAWLVIFDRQGVVNMLLAGAGWIDEPLHLRPSRFALIITMTYALLPFMVLPIYYSMRGVSLDTLRAAVSLGASPARAVVTAYVPHTLPGVTAGCLLVFVLCIGYYTLPALAAGPEDITVSMLIVEFTTKIANDGMAAAMAGLTLLVAAGFYLGYLRFYGPHRLANPETALEDPEPT